ncbi:recombinase RecT [Bacillus cytotoxicus]|uniref:Recombinase RecT n=1 Tax=Bacillus cytotoxicus TaxID=580165 RepID=A0ACC6A6A8_9BACI|nr:recombinase RecT [Bacillus cytotoxicus]
MANQVAVSNTQAVVGSFTQSELDTLKTTIALGTSDEQFALFVQTCVNAGLNPFLNHIYCIVYNTKNGPKMSIQIAVEGVLALARKTDGYKGVDAQLVHENDDFKYNATTKEIIHSVGFPRGRVIGGYSVAKREGFEDVVVLMEASEVEHMTKGRNADMWKDWFNDMFKKHLLKRSAKLQYGIEIGEDEPVASKPVEETPSYQPDVRVDITPNQLQIEEGEVIDTEEEIKNKWSAINEKLQEYGMTKDDLKAIIQEKFNKKPSDLSLQQIAALSKFIDLEHANRQKEQETVVIEPPEMNFDVELD